MPCPDKHSNRNYGLGLTPHWRHTKEGVWLGRTRLVEASSASFCSARWWRSASRGRPKSSIGWRKQLLWWEKQRSTSNKWERSHGGRQRLGERRKLPLRNWLLLDGASGPFLWSLRLYCRVSKGSGNSLLIRCFLLSQFGSSLSRWSVGKLSLEKVCVLPNKQQKTRR